MGKCTLSNLHKRKYFRLEKKSFLKNEVKPVRKDTRHFISIELKLTSKNAESFQHKTRKTPQKAFWTVLLATLQVLFMKETMSL